jgi:hypothetical protein
MRKYGLYVFLNYIPSAAREPYITIELQRKKPRLPRPLFRLNFRALSSPLSPPGRPSPIAFEA